MKIKEYLTIVSLRAAELDKEIKNKIEEGFQPFGNPYFSNKYFYQAMAKSKQKSLKCEVENFIDLWFDDHDRRETKKNELLKEGWEVFDIGEEKNIGLMNYFIRMIKYKKG